MKNTLITYYSESGSTKEIANLIASQLTNIRTEVLDVSKISHLNYDKIIIGTPNMYGKPAPKIIQFLKQKKNEISNTPIVLYFTCMDCYDITGKQKIRFDIYKDSHFQNNIKDFKNMNSWEKSHAISSYINNLNKIAPELNLVSIAFFKGRLKFKSLSFFNSLTMRLICLINKNIKEGDYFKHQDVKLWSKNLSSLLNS